VHFCCITCCCRSIVQHCPSSVHIPVSSEKGSISVVVFAVSEGKENGLLYSITLLKYSQSPYIIQCEVIALNNGYTCRIFSVGVSW
jgi:hypothetical protein